MKIEVRMIMMQFSAWELNVYAEEKTQENVIEMNGSERGQRQLKLTFNDVNENWDLGETMFEGCSGRK